MQPSIISSTCCTYPRLRADRYGPLSSKCKMRTDPARPCSPDSFRASEANFGDEENASLNSKIEIQGFELGVSYSCRAQTLPRVDASLDLGQRFGGTHLALSPLLSDSL